jgi:uncharacterized oxidoreductase
MAEHMIPTAALHRWVVDLFRAAGSSDREATLTADHLVGANLAGHDSHGVGMVPRYVDSLLNDELQLNRTVTVLSDTGTMLSVDGNRGMGQSVTHQAMELAIERARAHGVCVLGLRHSHHLGRVGHWAEQAVAAGMVSIHFTNAVTRNILVAPHGGGEARYNTNPFTVGMPRADGGPIILDFATSAVAQGKVRVAYNKKVPVPPGSLIDVSGEPTNDPAVMFEPPEGPHGALRPFAGHKGYALGVVCELLGAALIGGDTQRIETRPQRFGVWNNMLAIVFDPSRIAGAAGFEAEARRFVDWLQSSKLSSEGRGIGGIHVPGDPERLSRKARASQVPVDPGTMAQMDAAATAISRRFGQSPGPLSALERGC